MSGKQWACHSHLPRGGLGVPSQNFFEKVSALSWWDLATKHYNHSCDSTCTCKLPVKSGTGDCGYILKMFLNIRNDRKSKETSEVTGESD